MPSDHPYDEFLEYQKTTGKGNVLSYNEQSAKIYINYNKTNGTAARSWHRWHSIQIPVTWLNTCEVCNRTGTPKKVHERGDVWNWTGEHVRDYQSKLITMLCVSCWNKAKAIDRKMWLAQEIKTLGTRLYSEALKWRKSQAQQN